jgi:hypothetical protein
MYLGDTIRNVIPWFSWTHWTLENHRKHLNEHFHNFFWIHLLSSIDFEISIISRIFCILMFLIIAFKKSFRNVTLVLFFEFFDQKHKFGTWFMNFFMNFFSKVIWKSFNFIFYLWIFKVEAVKFLKGHFN